MKVHTSINTTFSHIRQLAWSSLDLILSPRTSVTSHPMTSLQHHPSLSPEATPSVPKVNVLPASLGPTAPHIIFSPLSQYHQPGVPAGNKCACPEPVPSIDTAQSAQNDISNLLCPPRKTGWGHLPFKAGTLRSIFNVAWYNIWIIMWKRLNGIKILCGLYINTLSWVSTWWCHNFVGCRMQKLSCMMSICYHEKTWLYYIECC